MLFKVDQSEFAQRKLQQHVLKDNQRLEQTDVLFPSQLPFYTSSISNSLPLLYLFDGQLTYCLLRSLRLQHSSRKTRSPTTSCCSMATTRCMRTDPCMLISRSLFLACVLAFSRICNRGLILFVVQSVGFEHICHATFVKINPFHS